MSGLPFLVLAPGALVVACGGISASEGGAPERVPCVEQDVFVAVDEVGLIAVREGGEWHAGWTGEAGDVYPGLIWAWDGVLAAGRHGKLLRSADGFDWEPAEIVLGGHVAALSFDGATLVALGSTFGETRQSWAARSADGTTWVELGPALDGVRFASVAHAGRTIVAVGHRAPEGADILPSALFRYDGGWLQSTPWTSDAAHYHEVLVAAGRFIATGGERLALSGDGVVWNETHIEQHVTGATSKDGLVYVTAMEGIGVFDGTSFSWTELVRSGIPGEIRYALEDLAVGECEILAVGGPMGWNASSVDGGEWVSTSGPSHFSFLNVVHVP